MKPRWLYILLALSLAANAVEVAVVVSKLLRETRQHRAWVTAPPHATALRPLMGLYGPESARLKRRLLAAQNRSLRIGNFHPDTVAIRGICDEIEQNKRETYWLAFKSTRALKDADPAQRRLAERQWRNMTGLPIDPGRRRR